jgi:Transposase zinc-ribbon domain/Transposase DDE domain
MARNKMQFQRGLSDVEFDRLYGTKELCRKAVFSWRWPDGVECPACGGAAHCELEKRGVTPAIKRELKRRAAVEPVIGHLKGDHRMDRNFLIGSHGDAANAVLAAVGYNFRRLAAWLKALWCVWLMVVFWVGRLPHTPTAAAQSA